MQLFGIESMFWGVELIRDYEKNLSEKFLESLQVTTKDLLDWMEEFDLAADVTKFGEHAVSEKVEYLISFGALLKDLG